MSEIPQQPTRSETRRSPPAGLAIRAMRPLDAEAVAALQDLPEFRRGTLRLPYPSPEEVRNWIERKTPGNPSLVAVIDGQIVGAAGLNRRQGRRAHAGGVGIGVHDAWAGQGIGTALLAALVDLAERWLGLRRLELTVFADNAPALALYRRFGFTEEGRHRAYALRDGVYVDALAMARLGGPELPRDVVGHD